MNSRLVIAVMAGLIVGCGGGDSTSPEKPTVTGSWIGTTGGQTLSFALVENSGAVTGSGSLTGIGGPFAQTISGTFVNPTLTITLTSGQHPPFTLTATLSGTALNGTLSGSGFQGEAITLNNTTTGAGLLAKVTVTTETGSTTLESETSTSFFATTRDKFDNLVNAPITWSSSAGSVATVTPSSAVLGVATVAAIAPGSATITATATSGSTTVTGTNTVTVTPSPWLGTWSLVSVNGLALPANFSQSGFATRVVSRSVTFVAGKNGTWADSSTSQLNCSPPTFTGAQCNAGGKANITWSPGSTNSLTMTPVSGTVTGTVSSKIFFRQADGTLTSNQGTQTEIYRKQ